MACEREDCAFMSVSLVRRIDVPLRIRLQRAVSLACIMLARTAYSRHDLVRIFHVHFAQPAPNDMPVLVLANLHLAPPAA